MATDVEMLQNKNTSLTLNDMSITKFFKLRISIVLFFVSLVILSIGVNNRADGRPSMLRAHAHKYHTYHVSVNGNDANAGTKSSPLRTISAAANLAMPGDTVLVHAGIYREQITPPRGGNSDAERIVYETAPGESVVIKGSELIKGWKKLKNDTWEVKIPNTFFGHFNPYKELIQGDWFEPTPKDRKYHRGAVYLNGDWLMEAAKMGEVMTVADKKNPLWWGEVDSTTTTIWAQFKNADPNKDLVEINVRPAVFYPDKPFINFITVRGFTMEQAATNWAPPTAEQMGLIGTHWSRGWIIENNTIQYSKCAGIALGKYGDEFDNKSAESAEGYVGTINRALAHGWNKGTIGGHIVRNNTIAYCEQVGIVGSMGCSFSTVEGNIIHDIYVHGLFTGAEMAGIKFHGAIDVQIKRNHIYRVGGVSGIWLDWMAQGAQIISNLMNDNSTDIFLEVDHGPMLVSNNILLSKSNLLMNSSGAVFAHNLFKGKIEVIHYDARLTPYMKPHSTYVVGLHDNPSGDVQFINNLFVNGGDANQYSNALLPVVFVGNVYTNGAMRATQKNEQNKFGEMNKDAEKQMKDYKEHAVSEVNISVDNNFDASVNLLDKDKKIYLEIAFDKKWLAQKRKIVTTATLTKAIVPDLPFENPDGSLLSIDKDYLGKNRNMTNPSPGPFEIAGSGNQKIRIW
jgi:alpha-N-arabinofuranosidase